MTSGYLKEEIQELIAKKQEGGYWDFKREWHINKANLLHDIICMANNLESRDAYIIFGIDEEQDYEVCGVNNDQNRKNTNDIVVFLRDKDFAGGYRPTVTIETIYISSVEIDVMIIHFDRHTPFFLSKDFTDGGKIRANYIYTRIQDTNTPKDKSADIDKIEQLWKRRFGLDANIYNRYLILLEQHDQWENDLGNSGFAFHKVFPEFKIETNDCDDGDRWLSQAAFYLNPDCGYKNMKLLYHSTIIYECRNWLFDGAKISIPGYDDDYLPFKIELTSLFDFQYAYYDLSKMNGKLFYLLTNGTCEYHSRNFHTDVHLFLIFNNSKEREDFEKFAINNYEKVSVDELRNNRIVKFALAQNKRKDTTNPEDEILEIAFASELFNMWKDSLAEQ